MQADHEEQAMTYTWPLNFIGKLAIGALQLVWLSNRWHITEWPLGQVNWPCSTEAGADAEDAAAADTNADTAEAVKIDERKGWAIDTRPVFLGPGCVCCDEH